MKFVGSIDMRATTSCQGQGCNAKNTGTLNELMDWAVDHHKIFDHEPHKPSTLPDIHNVFTVIVGDNTLELDVTSEFAHLFEGREQRYRKQYASSVERMSS